MALEWVPKFSPSAPATPGGLCGQKEGPATCVLSPGVCQERPHVLTCSMARSVLGAGDTGTEGTGQSWRHTLLCSGPMSNTDTVAHADQLASDRGLDGSGARVLLHR